MYKPSYWDQSRQYADGFGQYHPTPASANASRAYHTPYVAVTPTPMPMSVYKSPWMNISPPVYESGDTQNAVPNVVPDIAPIQYKPIKFPNIAKKAHDAKDFINDEIIKRGQPRDRFVDDNPWVHNNYVTGDRCNACDCVLGINHKRHHCRKCGKHFCRSCLKMRNWRHANHIKRWKSVSSAFMALGIRVLICKSCVP